ncbi:hypothetical protein AB4876_04565 [Zhongshania guokunii]|uniref:Uncharacterized protein n=1 Tax=Zhongshania guokunii TaxID=641783 RepID=A0ABV3U4G3_9GAMM
MAVQWTESATELNGSECILHRAVIAASATLEINQVLAECVERAAALLDQNVDDDSLYLLFEWEAATSILTAVVTDDSKSRDAKHRVQCDMSAMNTAIAELSASNQWQYQGESFTDIVKHGLRDYLTTCTGFMRFSLVAAFHSGSRQQSELL